MRFGGDALAIEPELTSIQGGTLELEDSSARPRRYGARYRAGYWELLDPCEVTSSSVVLTIDYLTTYAVVYDELDLGESIAGLGSGS